MTIADRDTQRSLPRGIEYTSRPRMPFIGLRRTLKTSPTLRHLAPGRLVVARAERKGERLFAGSEATRAHAMRTMAAVVCGTEREGELEELAHRYVAEREAIEALFWQPWRPPSIDERSRERLLEAFHSERGLVLSACHVGPFFNKTLAIFALGVEPVAVAGDFWFDEPSRDEWGRRLARWRRGVPNGPVVRPRGSYEVLRSVLQAGGVATVYYDLPGRRETLFLGKPVELVDGTARLAVETGAVILPMRSRRDGHRLTLQFREPLDPREHGGVDEVHEALARIHERSILEAPQEMEDPAEFGWHDQATATAWRRPGRSSNGER